MGRNTTHKHAKGDLNEKKFRVISPLRSRGTQECPCAILKQLAKRFGEEDFLRFRQKMNKKIPKKSKNHWSMTFNLKKKSW